jgi:hypothetical protein
MVTFYEVWDDRTGNRLGEYETLADASGLLHAVLLTSGPDSVRGLAVLAYTAAGADEYTVQTVLEGADFVASSSGVATSPVDAQTADEADGRAERRV